MSPYGSRFVEFIRFLANRFLPDRLRKRIKNGWVQLQHLPLKLSGVERLMALQNQEMERLKSRLTLLDGRLNLAVYGMPEMDSYQAAVLSHNLLPALGEDPVVRDTIDAHLRKLHSVSVSELAKAFTLPSLKSLGPSSCLFLGLEPQGLPVAVAQNFKSTLKEIAASDPRPERIEAAKRQLPIQGEWMRTDALSALLSFENKSFDLICSSAYPQLSPLEQPRFLKEAFDRLNDRGVLLLELPNLKNPQVLQDLYWTQAGFLRPFSLSLVKSLLQALGASLESVGETEDSSTILLISQKNRGGRS